jgi:hypothetical protein
MQDEQQPPHNITLVFHKAMQCVHQLAKHDTCNGSTAAKAAIHIAY